MAVWGRCSSRSSAAGPPRSSPGAKNGYPVGLKPRKVTTLYNGALECTLSLFDIAAEDTSRPREPGAAAPSAAPPLGHGAESFANRLRKNLRNLEKWAGQEGVTCYRLYDADLPEYNVAVDLYHGERLFVHVQEYEAPSTVDPGDADRRFREAVGRHPRAPRHPPRTALHQGPETAEGDRPVYPAGGYRADARGR